MSKVGKVINQIANRIRIFLKPNANSIVSTASLLPARPSELDPHHLSPYFKFSTDFYLHESVVKISRRQSLLEVEPHQSFLYQENFTPLFPRLLMVLQAYSSGISRILDHSENTTGRAFFYLDLADGGRDYKPEISPDANFYVFCRQRQQVGIGLIPDPYTLGDISSGVHFEEYRDKEVARAAYKKRKALVFWRGSTTGRLNSMDFHTNKRIKFCFDALEHPESIDSKITQVVQFPNNKVVLKALHKAGVMTPRVFETGFSKYMATIDLDGNSAAWGALRKYLFLMHVIKPHSNFEMFYNVNQPDGTFTSVENLEDIFRKIQLDGNLADNFETAWQGYLFARAVREKIIAGNATVFPVRYLNE